MGYINECPRLGIEIVDEQHIKLINLGNQLINLLGNQEDKDKIVQKYDEFIKFIENHFQTEEDLFLEFDYTDAERHIEMHRFFLEKLREPRENFVEFDIDLSVYIINFLNEWAKNHISSFDVEFAKSYLNFSKKIPL